MTTIYASVTDIRKNWTAVAKKIKKNTRVLVMKNSQPLYEIRPVESEEYVEYLDEKTSKEVEEAIDEARMHSQNGTSKTYSSVADLMADLNS